MRVETKTGGVEPDDADIRVEEVTETQDTMGPVTSESLLKLIRTIGEQERILQEQRDNEAEGDADANK
jgi:hypothetical protein